MIYMCMIEPGIRNLITLYAESPGLRLRLFVILWLLLFQYTYQTDVYLCRLVPS